MNLKAWSSFKKLHFLAAGGLTRTEESWELQRKIINSGNGCLVASFEPNGKMVGASFFAYNNHEAIYGSSANDKSFNKFPIGHGIQWNFLVHAKKLGLKKYRLGRASDYQSNLKERNIAKFKRGFTSSFEMWITGIKPPTTLINIPLNNLKFSHAVEFSIK